MTDEPARDEDGFARWWSETGEEELRQLLYWRWDPIGVNRHFPATVGEYDQYAPEIAAAVRDGASRADIAELLDAIESERMGLDGAPSEQLPSVAAEIVSWAARSQKLWQSLGSARGT